MTRAARSVQVFGIYLVALGVVLISLPNVLLAAFGLPLTTEVWIRVVGVLTLCISFYYLAAARYELIPLLRATVYARCAVFLLFSAFVAADFVDVPLVLFGAVDLAGALWTSLALRRS